MFRQVASSIWEVVEKFKKKANDLHVDQLEAIQSRNDVVEAKEATLGEKQRFDRALTKRTVTNE